jgi:hypothetical protein
MTGTIPDDAFRTDFTEPAISHLMWPSMIRFVDL